MITARKERLFEHVFALYNRNLIRRRFEGLRVAGLDHLQRHATGTPQLLYANHSSWWDGLIMFQLARVCKLDLYAMMEENNCDSIRFTASSVLFGCADAPARSSQSIEYASDMLRHSSRTLLIFRRRDSAERYAPARVLQRRGAHHRTC
jgi:1-acyl-sn-glycerol-3-phosphate acyltransferase